MDEQMSQSQIDNIINRLLQKGTKCEWNEFEAFKSEIEQICDVCSDIFLKESSLLHLKPPISIAGNFHGQFKALKSVFEHDGFPPRSKYLFLGNYVDSNGYFLETVLVLLAFKIKYPKNVFLLRGSLDAARWLNRVIVDECQMQEIFFNIINGCLECLPVAALINDKILCTHGGFSDQLHNLNQIRHIKRPTDIPDSRLLRDLLGSDPRTAKKVKHHAMEENEFLKTHDLHLICCGYQAVRGYKVVDEQRIVFICSATRRRMQIYENNIGEVGAMMSVDANLKYSFHILNPSATSMSKFESSLGDTTSKAATKSRSVFTGFKLAKWTNKPTSGNSTSTSKSESNQSMIISTAQYRSVSPEVKPAERNTKPSNGSSNPTTTTKCESSPGVNPSTSKATSKNRSVSPGYMPAERMSKSNIGGKTVTFNPESSQEGRPFDVDPATLYRSKSPGVKRFLGARV